MMRISMFCAFALVLISFASATILETTYSPDFQPMQDYTGVPLYPVLEYPAGNYCVLVYPPSTFSCSSTTSGADNHIEKYTGKWNGASGTPLGPGLVNYFGNYGPGYVAQFPVGPRGLWPMVFGLITENGVGDASALSCRIPKVHGDKFIGGGVVPTKPECDTGSYWTSNDPWGSVDYRGGAYYPASWEEALPLAYYFKPNDLWKGGQFGVKNGASLTSWRDAGCWGEHLEPRVHTYASDPTNPRTIIKTTMHAGAVRMEDITGWFDMKISGDTETTKKVTCTVHIGTKCTADLAGKIGKIRIRKNTGTFAAPIWETVQENTFPADALTGSVTGAVDKDTSEDTFNSAIGCEVEIGSYKFDGAYKFDSVSSISNLIVKKSSSQIGNVEIEPDVADAEKTGKPIFGNDVLLNQFKDSDKLGCQLDFGGPFDQYNLDVAGNSFLDLNVYSVDSSGSRNLIFNAKHTLEYFWSYMPLPAPYEPLIGIQVEGSPIYRKVFKGVIKMFDDVQTKKVLDDSTFKATRKLVCEFDWNGRKYSSGDTQILMNKKNPSAYKSFEGDKRAFIFSDIDWRVIFQAVPAVVWPKSNWDDCISRTYTSGLHDEISNAKCIYPMLLYHAENNHVYLDSDTGMWIPPPDTMNEDSIFHVIQEYGAGSVFVTKVDPMDTTPSDIIDHVLLATGGTPYIVWKNWWKDQWEGNPGVAVVVDYDNYKTALLGAARLASLYNAPLIFVGSSNTAEWQDYLKGKMIIIADDLSCADCLAQLKESSYILGYDFLSYDSVNKKIFYSSDYEATHDKTFSLDDLREFLIKYDSYHASLTDPTKKAAGLIIVNPNDINSDFKESLSVAGADYNLYGSHSLLAPYMASALDMSVGSIEVSALEWGILKIVGTKADMGDVLLEDPVDEDAYAVLDDKLRAIDNAIIEKATTEVSPAISLEVQKLSIGREIYFILFLAGHKFGLDESHFLLTEDKLVYGDLGAYYQIIQDSSGVSRFVDNSWDLVRTPEEASARDVRQLFSLARDCSVEGFLCA